MKVALPTPTSRPPDAAAVLARLRLAVADALDVFPVPAVHGGGVGAAAAGGAGDPPSEAAAGSRRPSVALDGEETPAGCSPLSSRASVHCMPVCGGLGCRLVCAVCRAVGVAVGGGCGCGWWTSCTRTGATTPLSLFHPSLLCCGGCSNVGAVAPFAEGRHRRPTAVGVCVAGTNGRRAHSHQRRRFVCVVGAVDDAHSRLAAAGHVAAW